MYTLFVSIADAIEQNRHRHDIDKAYLTVNAIDGTIIDRELG